MSRAQELMRGIIRRVMQPIPKLKVWEWIDLNMRIPIMVGSKFPGPIRTGRTPPLRGLWDRYWHPDTRFFTLAKSARTGGTLFSIGCVLHKIACWVGPILWVDPSRKTAMRFCRAELQPYILDCRATAKLAIQDREHWTGSEMYFRNGATLGVVGAGSPAELAGRQAEMVILNESDKIRHTLFGEAPPHQLAIVRSKQFRHTRKILRNSTPTVFEADTWQSFLKGSQDYCYIPCPHCQKKQRLAFFPEEKEVPFDEDGRRLPKGQKRLEKTGQFKFDFCRIVENLEVEPGKFEDVVKGWDIERVEAETKYECAHCKELIDHNKLNWMNARYDWRSHNIKAPKDTISAHYWGAYSPFEHWGQIAKKYVLALGSAGDMHDFWNSDLGLPFQRKATTVHASDIEKLQKASPPYILRTLPREAELLTMTVDVQGNGFWWTIYAWGVIPEMPGEPYFAALVDYGQAVSWEQIEEFAGLRPDAGGRINTYRFGEREYRVLGGLVDSGFQAQKEKAVYDFCMRNREIFNPSKGGGRHQLRGGVFRTTPVFDNQLTLVWYYDDFFKQKLYYDVIKERRLLRFFPSNLGEDFIAHLTDERTVPVKLPNGSIGLKWETETGENHLGDCCKMQEVLADEVTLGIDKILADREATTLKKENGADA